MSTPVDLNEFLPPYLAEVEELLALSRRHLLASEGSAPTPLAVRELFRAVHTIKGLSAMIDVEPIVEIAHVMESALRSADRNQGLLPKSAVEPLLEGLRAIEQRVQSLASRKAVLAAPRALLERLAELDSAPRAAAPSAGTSLAELEEAFGSSLSAAERSQLDGALAKGQRVLRLEFSPSPERSEAGLNINSVREKLKVLGELIKVVPKQLPKSPQHPAGLTFVILVATSADDAQLLSAAGVGPESITQLSAPPAPEAAPEVEESAPEEPEQATGSSVIRVGAERLDEVLERLSALFVGRSRLQRAAAALTASGAQTRELQQLLAEHTRQLRDLRAAFLSLRMVPVSQVLQGLPLVMRGLRRSTGREAQLEMDVRRVEIDKAVGDRLLPAIVHLVRNAVDHAIEPEAERVKAGKPPQGTVRIRCHQRSSAQLELTVEDDGRGVDAAAVARGAGVPVPESPAALLELLCRPGLSTRKELSTTSGRGMGMDIVRRIVEGMGGQLSLSTTPGKGSRFVLLVPLTISIVDALVFEASGERYAAPLSAVEELIEFEPSRVVKGPSFRGGAGHFGIIERRGVALPVVALGALMGKLLGDGGHKALVVKQGEEAIAFAVDRMIGQQEIVVRPLEDVLIQVSGVAGATDLGDGRPTLVLDLPALGGAALDVSREGKSA